jgi:hypothetical protein
MFRDRRVDNDARSRLVIRSDLRSTAKTAAHYECGKKSRPVGACSGPRISHRRFNASSTFSAVIGSDLILTPTASSTALAIAAVVGMIAVSPMLML